MERCFGRAWGVGVAISLGILDRKLKVLARSGGEGLAGWPTRVFARGRWIATAEAEGILDGVGVAHLLRGFTGVRIRGPGLG